MPVEFDGKRYEQTSAHQKEWGTRLIQGLNLRGDERILDVGCGDGALTAKLAEAVPDINIDASPWIPGISDIEALLDVLPSGVHVQVGSLYIERIGSEVKFAGMKFTQEYIDTEYQKHREIVGNDSCVRWK